MTSEKYSLIIIGGGITGLSCALAWVKNRDPSQYPVLLLEKQPIVGGMVTTFKRKGYSFDTAQLIPDPVELFRYLQIDCELKKYEGYFSRIFLVNSNQVTGINFHPVTMHLWRCYCNDIRQSSSRSGSFHTQRCLRTEESKLSQLFQTIAVFCMSKNC